MHWKFKKKSHLFSFKNSHFLTHGKKIGMEIIIYHNNKEGNLIEELEDVNAHICFNHKWKDKVYFYFIDKTMKL